MSNELKDSNHSSRSMFGQTKEEQTKLLQNLVRRERYTQLETAQTVEQLNKEIKESEGREMDFSKVLSAIEAVDRPSGVFYLCTTMERIGIDGISNVEAVLMCCSSSGPLPRLTKDWTDKETKMFNRPNIVLPFLLFQLVWLRECPQTHCAIVSIQSLSSGAVVDFGHSNSESNSRDEFCLIPRGDEHFVLKCMACGKFVKFTRIGCSPGQCEGGSDGSKGENDAALIKLVQFCIE